MLLEQQHGQLACILDQRGVVGSQHVRIRCAGIAPGLVTRCHAKRVDKCVTGYLPAGSGTASKPPGSELHQPNVSRRLAVPSATARRRFFVRLELPHRPDHLGDLLPGLPDALSVEILRFHSNQDSFNGIVEAGGRAYLSEARWHT